MSVGSVLSRAFAAVSAQPGVFFGVAFLSGALPYLLFTFLVLGAERMDPARLASLGQVWPLAVGGGLVWLVLYVAAKALLLRAAAAYGDGRREAIGDLIGPAIASALPLFGMTLLFYLAISIGFTLLIVPGVILATVWAVAGPALVFERAGVFGGFARSAALTKGARWRVLGLIVVVFAIYFVALFVLGALVGAAALGTGTSTGLVDPILSAVLQTVFTALWAAIQASLYIELRDWKEGPQGARLADIFA